MNFQSLNKSVLNENAALEQSFQLKPKGGTGFTKLTFSLKNLMRHTVMVKALVVMRNFGKCVNDCYLHRYKAEIEYFC